MKKRECVDILLATYNGEKYLKEQIESILNQTYSEIRVIISDDASTDGTIKIIEEFVKKDKRVEAYFRDKNIGSNQNFEFLLSKVVSKYYMFSDQDDVWQKSKIENSVAKLITSSAGLVCTDLTLADENLNSLNVTFNTKMGYENKLKKLNDWKMVYLYNVVTGCTIISKKEYIKYILPFPKNKNILHDHIVSLIVGSKSKIEYLDAPTIYYRQHKKNQVGTKKYTDKFRSFEETRNYLIDLKLSIFNTYLEIGDRINSEFVDMTKDAILYFEHIKNVKNINFKYKKIFRKLYKYETRYYRFWNSFLFNYPIFAKIWYNLFKKKK